MSGFYVWLFIFAAWNFGYGVAVGYLITKRRAYRSGRGTEAR